MEYIGIRIMIEYNKVTLNYAKNQHGGTRLGGIGPYRWPHLLPHIPTSHTVGDYDTPQTWPYVCWEENRTLSASACSTVSAVSRTKLVPGGGQPAAGYRYILVGGRQLGLQLAVGQDLCYLCVCVRRGVLFFLVKKKKKKKKSILFSQLFLNLETCSVRL